MGFFEFYIQADFKYLYSIDNYDSYNYVAMGSISLMASLVFIIINIKFPKARAFPGNLLLFTTFAELCLCVHWVVSGLWTKFLLKVPEVEENSLFCRSNSFVAYIFANMEFLFHVSFIFSVIIKFKNVMKSQKGQSLFWIIPLIGVAISTYIAWQNDLLGKNIYGTCSLRQMKKTGRSYLIINGIYVMLSFYAIYVLRNFMALEKKKVYFVDDFYSFYFNYISMIIILYLVLGANYVLAGYIMKCFEFYGDKTTCYKVYFVSKIVNTIKIFTPLIAFLVRTRDPFYQKLIFVWLQNRKRKLNSSNSAMNTSLLLEKIEEEPSIIITDNFAVANQLVQIKKGIVRTILNGLTKYYSNWIDSIDFSAEDSFIEKIEYVLKGNEEVDQNESVVFSKNLEDLQIFECTVTSFGAVSFKDLIKKAKIENIESAFDLIKNKNKLEGLSENGGAGGEFMLQTWDSRFFIKTMNDEELEVFKKINSNYTNYFSQNPDSYIVKIIGMFTFDFRITGQKVHVFVNQNVFTNTDKFILRKYDLKGSTYKRQTLMNLIGENRIAQKMKIKEILKDIDFQNIERNFYMRDSDRSIIVNQLEKDSKFFKNVGLMDYSLLLGIIDCEKLNENEMAELKRLKHDKVYFVEDKKIAVTFGIIDYFQMYNMQKLGEKYSRKIQNCNCNLDTSSQPSGFYSERFINQIKNIFI